MKEHPPTRFKPWQRQRQVLRLLGKLVGSRTGLIGTPFFLSHLLTARCSCSCPTCLWRNNNSPEMDTAEVESLYREAAASGFAANVIWGGEPLLREDLPRLCRVSRQEGMSTQVITNAYHLPERYDELCPELESVIVSLDYADAARHDASRQCDGLFERALRGIRLVREHHPQVKVVLNFLLHRNNREELEGVLRLAQELNVSLYLSPAMEGTVPETGNTNRSSLAAKEDRKETARKIIALKKEGFPINNSRRYLQRYLLEEKDFQCRVPLIFFNVLADGTLLNCFTPGRAIGRYRRGEFRQIIYRQSRKERLQLGLRCQQCIVPDVVETSYIWNLSPGPLFNMLRVFSRP